MEEENAPLSESGKDIVTEALDRFFNDLIGRKMRVNGHDYSLVEKLGVGGQAVVYAAKCEDETEPNYAVKLLLRQSRTNFERCFRESNIGNLQHPNLVRALGIGEIKKGSLGILFERVYGRPLSDYLGGGQAALPRILQWGEQIADVLLFIHEQGFVHRDIKPSNILITDADGSVKLTDFGFCFDMNDDQSLSRVGAAGTLPYMSPEHGIDESPQSDYFSLGIVLHETVYGNRIHDTSEIDRSNPDFATLIECCMQPDKRNRYPVGTELKEDIQALRRGEAPKNAKRLLAQKKRRFVFRGSAAIALLSAIGFGTWQYCFLNADVQEEPEASTSTQIDFTPNYSGYQPIRLLKDEDYPKVMSDFDLNREMLKIHELFHHTPPKDSAELSEPTDSPDSETKNDPQAESFDAQKDGP